MDRIKFKNQIFKLFFIIFFAHSNLLATNEQEHEALIQDPTLLNQYSQEQEKHERGVEKMRLALEGPACDHLGNLVRIQAATLLHADQLMHPDRANVLREMAKVKLPGRLFTHAQERDEIVKEERLQRSQIRKAMRLAALEIVKHAQELYNRAEQLRQRLEQLDKRAKQLRKLKVLALRMNEKIQEISSSAAICPICTESNPVDPILTACCNHFFHSKCLRQALLNNDRCPICRKTSPSFYSLDEAKYKAEKINDQYLKEKRKFWDDEQQAYIEMAI